MQAPTAAAPRRAAGRCKPVVSAGRAATLAEWLDAAHKSAAVQLLRTGARLPQETITATRLRSTANWRDDFRTFS